MKLTQLSVFLENKPGRLTEPCRVLAEEGIDILTLSLADTQQFGILRILVRDWERAREVLEQAHCVVNATEVVALEVEDRPGGLLDVLRVIEQCTINVEYMYAMTFRRGNKAIIIFRFENPEEAVQRLSTKGISMIDADELYRRISG
ncbi:MAG TPA: amino acid-binding protein [Thermodesulfobacteriota bacterium]|nr:amino acid-binding protein [Deltaproteobacteria bacterium]HNU71050.1 amino acid-binding protein [Thermodesulfobacteriota bacterium]HQO77872.1 amino acid-binding protein [Thermodesulfobacteriota bacterium]